MDFLEGWMTKTDIALIRPETLQQASTSASAASTAPLLTPPGASSSGTGGSIASNKAPRTASATTASGAGGSGSGSGGGSRGKGGTPSAASSFQSVSKICVFQQHIPCSKHIVGDTLGVAGAPPCKLCGQGAHYHGECPQRWGGISTPLPGHQADGSRIAGQWKNNEPIQSVIKAWIKLLNDKTNFKGSLPVPAGVAGAPTLAGFKARVPTAPVKP